jgi:hypothetical protein
MNYPAVGNKLGSLTPRDVPEGRADHTHVRFRDAHKIAINGKLDIGSADITNVGGKDYKEAPMEIFRNGEVKIEPFRRGI